MCLFRVVLAQLEGSGRGALGAYNSEDYTTLSDFLSSEPLRDGDEWLAKLMNKSSLLGGWPVRHDGACCCCCCCCAAARVMEVWEACTKKLAFY